MKQKKVPLRMCIGCAEQKEKKELVRVVKNKDGEIFIDKTGKSDGRGAYICPKEDCFNLAKKRRKLERSFKCKIDEEVYDKLKLEME